MTFRDDHEAALARASALEGEVERANEKLAGVEAERDRLRAEVERLSSAPREQQAERTPDAPRERRRTTEKLPPRDGSPAPTGFLLLILAIAATILLGIVLIVRGGGSDEQDEVVDPPESPVLRDCTVRTEPPGADVMMVVTRYGQTVAQSLGKTPHTKSAFEWSLYLGKGPVGDELNKVGMRRDDDHLELHLDGYAPLLLEAPCDDVVRRLEKLAPAVEPP